MGPADSPEFELDRAVSSARAADGTHTMTVTGAWNTPNNTPNGGYLLAMTLQAVLAESPLPDPLTASISYFRPPVPGEVTVHVAPLRAGRRVATFTATMRQGDALVLHAVVSTHDADATSDIQHPSEPPPFPPPDDCIDVMDSMPFGTIPIIDRFDYRHDAVPGWTRGEPSGRMTATYWARPKDGRPIDAIAAAVLVDAYPPVTIEIGRVPSATVQLTVTFRRRPQTRWALTHIVSRHVIDGFHDEDVELWDADGRLIAESRQLAILPEWANATGQPDQPPAG